MKILVILNKSKEELEEFKLGLFLSWGYSLSNSTKQHQGIIANAAISRYFNYEWEKLETQFIKEMQPYEEEKNIKPGDAWKIYTKTIIDIFKVYPKALIEDVKNIKIENTWMQQQQK